MTEVPVADSDQPASSEERLRLCDQPWLQSTYLHCEWESKHMRVAAPFHRIRRQLASSGCAITSWRYPSGSYIQEQVPLI